MPKALKLILVCLLCIGGIAAAVLLVKWLW
jgi:hypothetical protein